MGILGKLRRNKDDDDFDGEDDLEEGPADIDGMDEVDETPSGGGLFGRMKLKLKRSGGGEDDEDDEFLSEIVAPEAVPVTVIDAPAGASSEDERSAAAAGGGGASGENNAPNTDGNPSAPSAPVNIVDGPNAETGKLPLMPGLVMKRPRWKAR